MEAASDQEFTGGRPSSTKLEPGPHLELRGAELICRFVSPQKMLSWALARGGFTETDAVVWCRFTEADLPCDCDAAGLLRERLMRAGLPHAVGLMTSRRLGSYVDVAKCQSGIHARVIATVGLSNALRTGDAPGVDPRRGTINILAWLSRALTPAAMVEALALVSEARTAVLIESDTRSRVSGRLASGTGTDCLVMASPSGGEPLDFVGKHTVAGSVLGQAVEEAIRLGVERWKAEVAGRS